MSHSLSSAEKAKFISAKRAMAFVEPGMRLGLGTGSTANWLIRLIGQEVRENGLNISAVATSTQTIMLAEACGITMHSLDDVGQLDLTIDGADEIDPALNLIKGAGGALLQEKIVATASDRMLVIADASKSVQYLGRFPLPVEVVRFGWNITQSLIEKTLSDLNFEDFSISLRTKDNEMLITDEGHYILDLHLDHIKAPHDLSVMLTQIPGVVETGLFLGIADRAIIGHSDGRVEVCGTEVEKTQFETIDITCDDSAVFGMD